MSNFNIYSEFMILKLIKLLFCISWEKSYHFLFQSVKVMHYIDILIFSILKQHHIPGLWFLLQCIFLLTYCSDDIANILWKIRYWPVILILPTFLVRFFFLSIFCYLHESTQRVYLPVSFSRRISMNMESFLSRIFEIIYQ